MTEYPFKLFIRPIGFTNDDLENATVKFYNEKPGKFKWLKPATRDQPFEFSFVDDEAANHFHVFLVGIKRLTVDTSKDGKNWDWS